MSEQEFIELYLSSTPEIQKVIERILKRDKDAPPLTPEEVRQICIDCGVDMETFEEVSEGMKAKGYWL